MLSTEGDDDRAARIVGIISGVVMIVLGAVLIAEKIIEHLR